jgi:hypothetical protein
MPKILIWTGAHDPLDGAIKFLTHGRGTHAAFLRADGATVHEAFWPKVRDRALTDADLQNARAFAIEGVTHQQCLAFEHLFDANLRRGIRYSIVDLFRYALNMPSRDEHHTFCSRYVLHCCNAILHEYQMPLIRIPDHDWASPRDLLISPRLSETDVLRAYLASAAALPTNEQHESRRSPRSLARAPALSRWERVTSRAGQPRTNFMNNDTIHIKPSHKGLLTEKARAAGKSPIEFAHYVLAHKDIFHPATIKEAQFAVNASKWKK